MFVLEKVFRLFLKKQIEITRHVPYYNSREILYYFLPIISHLKLVIKLAGERKLK